MKFGVVIAALAGLGLAGLLVAWSGVDAVGHSVAVAGWQGLWAISAFQVVPIVFCGLAWRVIVPRGCVAGPAAFVWARFLRDGVGQLLAVLPVAEPVLATRMLVLRGVGAPLAIASVIADLTLELAAQVAFTLVGVALLFLRVPDSDVVLYSTIGAMVAAPALAGFVVVQRKGLFGRMERFAARLSSRWEWPGGPQMSQALDRELHGLYGHGGRLAAGFILHLAAWLVSCGGTWIALRAMGHPLGFAECVILESLMFAIRNVAFFIPWGAGVQEGGYALIGALLGMGPETALALSLLKRARDVVLGAPCILIWQMVEGRRLWRNGADV
ncbi:MAG: lysylphosphatidylglycerol synthase domain-containing protein [Alphaproteobacteria bacterium]